MLALYINVKEELADYIAKQTTANSTIKETMKSQFLGSLFWALDNTTKFRFIQQFHTSPYINQVEQEILDKQVLPHLSLIKKGIKEGVIKSLPVDLIYSLIANQTFGLYQFVTTNKLSKAKQHDTIQTTFEMLWDMLT